MPADEEHEGVRALRDLAPAAALVCLDAFAGSCPNVLIHLFAHDVGATPVAVAVALSASFFAGRGVSQLIAPASLAALDSPRLLEVSALLVGAFAVWLAFAPSLAHIAAARFVLGTASGASVTVLVAMPSACAHTGRRRRWALYLAHASALVGVALAQAPFGALCAVIGWRHALLIAHCAPALLVLGASRLSRACAAPASTPALGVTESTAALDAIGLPDWVGAALARVRRPHFRLSPIVVSAMAAHCSVDLLSGPWGGLVLAEGLGAWRLVQCTRGFVGATRSANARTPPHPAGTHRS
mmetsp:Transcript_25879/g.66934  ORF Transcript_25879/g.66934 Transcript_25879/m.66934 type:complete len:299 (+) Transcript_25879:3-899(+)